MSIDPRDLVRWPSASLLTGGDGRLVSAARRVTDDRSRRGEQQHAAGARDPRVGTDNLGAATAARGARESTGLRSRKRGKNRVDAVCAASGNRRQDL